MKLLFIENRYKTYFFEAIALKLLENGHEIHFLIQNKKFKPNKNLILHQIPYPKNNEGSILKKQIENVIESDRQLNFFKNKNKSHFNYYFNKIDTIIKELKPNLVFGESTAFHELLTIQSCKNNAILYLNPSSCRFPIGRFSFYKYDTLEPYLGSNEKLSNTDALEIIDSIIHRKKVPDYMQVKPISFKKKIVDKMKLLYSYYSGEKYNTPNPFIKIELEKNKKKLILKWNSFSEYKIKSSKFKVLYPLQMQPEANIDVWGRKYRNQTDLIKQISENLPKNTVLYVKPNPKSKYELSNGLIQLIDKKNNIVALHHITKMDELFNLTDLIITVTGTVAIECILTNKPVLTLIDTINNTNKNCIHISNIEKLPKIISLIKNNSFPKIDNEEKINFITLLTKTSFKGIISDPFNDKKCLSKKNLSNMADSFNKIITITTNLKQKIK